MVGRLWPQKNPGCLLEAAQKVLRSANRPVKFYFIGDGELREQLEQLTNSGSGAWKKAVVFPSWRTGLPRLLSAFDVFL